MPILTQKISLNLTQSKLPPLIMHTDEQGRRINFELVDENGDVITLTDDYSARYSQKKPDGNFVSELLSISEDGKLLILNQVTQMTAVPGISYYDIHVYNGSDIIYSGQGRVVVDDHILDNDTISSVSEVNGLVFPDDFLTIDSPVAVIDDDVSSTESTWSSSKISDEISNIDVLHTYSSVEKVVGKWIDGSDIYEKTIIRNNTLWGGTLDTGISDMRYLIYAEWCMTGELNVVPSVTNNGSYIRCQHDGNGILRLQGGSFDADINRTWYLTIRYTKEV